MARESEFDVFLSYSRSDREAARAVEKALASYGWSVFRDREIPSGERWESSLRRQLDAVPCVLVLWSASARASEWVDIEASRGRERGALVHVTLDGAPPPPGFADLQASDLSEWSGKTDTGDFRRLVRAVAMKVGVPGQLGSLQPPEQCEDVTSDHLALASTSWLDEDKVNPLYPFKIHLRLVGSKEALEQVETVTYYFDPAYAKNDPDHVDPNLEAYVHVRSDWRDGFTVIELANGWSVVRAAVKVENQAKIVGLARLVDIMEAGPRLDELYPIDSGLPHPGRCERS